MWKRGLYIFSILLSAFARQKNGKIEKCDNCDKWYVTEKGCDCQAPKSKEKYCKECGKPSGKYDMCYNCYKKPKDNTNDFTRKAIIKEIDIDSTDIRKKWETMERCNDGHYVRSYSEVLIDNWLYDNGHVHAFEKKVFLKNNPTENLLSDFYLPEGKIYIEFFGLDNEKYKQRKDDKIKLYENNSLNLICLNKEHLKVLDDILPKLIYDFQDNSKNS